MVDVRQLEIAVIGDEDLVSALRLAGVRRYRVIKEEDNEDFRQAVTEFINDPAVAIIVVLEGYLAQAEQLIAQAQERKTSPPVAIVVPSKYGTRYGDVTQYYKGYIRKFIGFDIEI